MILPINKVRTTIAILHKIPRTFFKKLDSAIAFNNDLFPAWANNVFGATDLQKKFKSVYDAYKALPDQVERDLVITAFNNSNEIERLCNNEAGLAMITINDLHATIREPIERLFSYLYNAATKYHAFESYVKENNVSKSVDAFILKHKIEVCPICGLEGFSNLAGQARLALDHWLCQDIFPFASVNFNNLIPIGGACNGSPAKGSNNVLLNRDTRIREVAYYPYKANHGIKTRFRFINEPTIDGIKDEDWSFTIQPNDIAENAMFQSWNNTFNIDSRYEDFVRKNILNMWEADYKGYIDDNPALSHATDLASFKNNLLQWKSSFKKKKYAGYRAYRSFANYLIHDASDAYLTGLYKNLPLY